MINRLEILNDQDFWERLEFHVSRLLGSSSDKALRRFWIDGFIPNSATNTRRGLDVEGAAWVVDGRGDHSYQFVTSIPQNMLHKRTRDFEIESLTLDCDRAVLRLIISERRLENAPTIELILPRIS